MNKITSIIAAVNYDDLLDITLTENKHNFDETIIITDTKDIKTQQLTKKHNVKCFVTDIFYINNNKFNRGMAYNAVLSELKHELDWVLLMDADVVLEKDFKNLFFNLNPEKEYFYGCRRYDVQTYEEWIKIKENPELLKKYLLYRGIGYGYFQLFNFNSNVIKNFINNNNYIIYPPYPTVTEGDWKFRNYWGDYIYEPCPPDQPLDHYAKETDHPTKLLKELPFYAIHLGITGINEYSRKTQRFC